MAIDLISRSDDFGSAQAANYAILEAVRTGCVTRNVSCMAPAPYIEEGAEALKRFSHICIGVHLTLNSEWEGIRWGALSDGACRAGITDEKGFFYQTTEELAKADPDIEGILREYDAQLDRLVRLGLNVEYADSHMMPECAVPGLDEALSAWIRKKGLLDVSGYYRFPQDVFPRWAKSEEQYLENVEKWLAEFSDGEQYLYLTHPARKCLETLLLCNEMNPAGKIQKERNLEYKAVTSENWEQWVKRFDLRLLKYTEAKPADREAQDMARCLL